MAASVIFAESVSSLYPILIKTVDATLFSQVLVRMVTMSMVSSMFISKGLFMDVLTNPKFYGMSLFQIFHIFVSYKGFSILDAGTAMTIFYTYPLMNVVIKNMIDKEPFDNNIMGLLGLAFLGTFIISYPSLNLKNNKNNKIFYVGLIAMLLSALTESLTYHFYKQENQLNPFDSLFSMYFIGSIIMLLFMKIKNKNKNDNNLNSDNITKLIMFNIFIGLVAFSAKFYGLPRISTEMYSVLSFIGIISAYVFGYYFLNEKITIYHVIGTLLIMFSINGVYKLNK
jgi:drug/metabolite transporter (DMT)-like permease